MFQQQYNSNSNLIKSEDESSSYEYLVNVFDGRGTMIEQKRFKQYSDAQAFLVQENSKGHDTHLSRLQLITE